MGREELELGNGQRLPWLETAEEYDTRRRRGWGTIAVALLGLVVLMMVVSGIWYTQRGGSTAGNGELISAEPGPYKVRTPGRDGLRVGSDSDAMLATSEGQEASGRIAGGSAAAVGASEVQAAQTRDLASDQGPALKPLGKGGAAVQLGAYESDAIARERWAALSRDQRSLAERAHSVEQVAAGGKTVFRLRVGVADRRAAAILCEDLQKLKIACFVVG